MSKHHPRTPHPRLLSWIAVGAMVLVVSLVITAVVIWIRQSPHSTTRPHPNAHAPSTSSITPSATLPPTQSQDCPDIQLISVPGTWESSPSDDPLNPTEFPRALLLNVTHPLQEQFDPHRVQLYTIPYTAQFHNPLTTDNQISYNQSRAEGTSTMIKAIVTMNHHCPLTRYIFIGFSQGAVIAGDVTSDIGNGRGPIPANLVLGVTLIADGRRQNGVGTDISPDPPGQGAEILLHELPLLAGMGLSMTGPRQGGFGSLNELTNEICAPGDLICAAPREAFSLAQLPETLQDLAGGAAHPVHALYATTECWDHNGQSATEWTLDWAHHLIDSAPQPAH